MGRQAGAHIDFHLTSDVRVGPGKTCCQRLAIIFCDGNRLALSQDAFTALNAGFGRVTRRTTPPPRTCDSFSRTIDESVRVWLFERRLDIEGRRALIFPVTATEDVGVERVTRGNVGPRLEWGAVSVILWVVCGVGVEALRVEGGASDATAAGVLPTLLSENTACDAMLCGSGPLGSVAPGELESWLTFRLRVDGASKDVVLSLLAETVVACGALIPERKGMKSQEPEDDEKREGVMLAMGDRRLEGTEDLAESLE